MSQETKKPHVFLIAALTADGFIARHSEEFAGWTSIEDKARFVRATKRAGVMIMGSRTYKTFVKPLKGRLHVVYSTTQKFEADSNLTPEQQSQIITTNDSPREVIDMLAAKGYTEIAICGGASIYTLFMNSGLVDELILTYEPVLFGTGIQMFNEPINEGLSLELHSSEIVDTETRQGTPIKTAFTSYKVIRSGE